MHIIPSAARYIKNNALAFPKREARAFCVRVRYQLYDTADGSRSDYDGMARMHHTHCTHRINDDNVYRYSAAGGMARNH